LKSTYILRQNTRSSEFGSHYIEKYINCLNIGFGQFDFIVMDAESNKVLVFESYELDGVQTYEGLVGLLQTLYEKHDCLPAGFWKKIIVNISTPKHTLIREKFYRAEDAKAFLKLNVSLNDELETAKNVTLHKQSIVSAFAFPNVLKDWLQGIYPKNLIFTHDIASFLSGLSKAPEKLIKSNLFILLKKDYLHIASFKGGNVAFANSFACRTVSDFMYYILLISEELQLNRSEAILHLYGHADDRSAFYTEAQKYFGQVELGKTPTQIQFTKDTENIPTGFEVFGAYFLGK